MAILPFPLFLFLLILTFVPSISRKLDSCSKTNGSFLITCFTFGFGSFKEITSCSACLHLNVHQPFFERLFQAWIFLLSQAMPSHVPLIMHHCQYEQLLHRVNLTIALYSLYGNDFFLTYLLNLLV